MSTATATATMWAVQFSSDGVDFTTLIKFDRKRLAESVMKAASGHGAAFGQRYWRVRKADQESTDFNAVK